MTEIDEAAMARLPLSGRPDPGPGRRGMRVLAGLVVLLICVLTFAGVKHQTAGRLGQQAMVQAESRAQALDSVLAKQRAVAVILSDDHDVIAALAHGDVAPALSAKLDRLQSETRSAVVYLLDDRGTAIAASNWNEPESFVGIGYGFRGYFTEAMRSGSGLEFALGTVSHRPGLYLSHAVSVGGRTLGVVVVKVEFDEVEAGWAGSGDAARVVDAAGTVLLSSDPRERFGRLPKPAADELAVRAALVGADWTLVQSASLRPATEAAIYATGSAALVMGLIALAVERAGRRRRLARAEAEADARYRADLERAVTDRTRDLSDEMRERRDAERRLAELQADLVQANKLAALGQTAAGLAHEVNQPLATIRTLAETALAIAPAATPAPITDNLATIARMTDRVSQITTELRHYARKATGHLVPVGLAEALKASLMLTESRRRHAQIPVELPRIPPGLRVMAEGVRLEQVLVNLLQNAEEALAERPDPRIRIALVVAAETVTLAVADNGPGLAPDIAGRLFTPFATTKPGGLGLGLVIAEEIARDFGGALSVDPVVPGQGAVFRLKLQRAEDAP